MKNQNDPLPPPSALVTTFEQARYWLAGEAHRVIRASLRRMKDGTAAFPPQVGIGYEAFWLRDYAYCLEGSADSFSTGELTDACRLFVRNVRADGAGVDCVQFDGTAIYKPGYGAMGQEPVTDGPAFTVDVVWHTWRQTRDEALRQECFPALVRTMDYLPRNPTNGLVHIAAPGERCPYGFTDSIPKSGDQLFDSLLAVQAYRQLGELAGGQHYTTEAERIAGSVRTVLWDASIGLFRATTGNCNVPDIWGSAFAVYLDVATREQSLAIARYFRDHYGELTQAGQVRHVPGFMDWQGRQTATNGGSYQSGAFWGTPVGWFVYTLDLVDANLAEQALVDMVRFYQQHGTCEWINGEQLRFPGYLASAALPLAGIRALQQRRASQSGSAGRIAAGRVTLESPAFAFTLDVNDSLCAVAWENRLTGCTLDLGNGPEVAFDIG
ncbi:MAG: hypothetical protein O2901_15865 [Verrucomicrobia bacterium]|nr:hypothetical protein [Verrucomicrobiota bacterium]